VYDSRKIDTETLRTLFECARFAPTHKKTQPWNFKVFTGAAKDSLAQEVMRAFQEYMPAEKFSEAKQQEFGKKVEKSAAVALIILDAHPDLLPEWEEIAALGAAVQNLWLACTTKGIGSYWSSPGFIKNLSGFLKLQENQRCLGIFYMGYSEVELPVWDRKPVEDFVEIYQ
jgi:nitroreductase